jgi:hypothetical protein
MPSDDRSLKGHLATKVMGCHRPQGCNWWYNADGMAVFHDQWQPLDSWADAGMVWEKARGMGIRLELHGRPESTWYCSWKPTYCVTEDSGPRAICEAIARATGFEEEK